MSYNKLRFFWKEAMTKEIKGLIATMLFLYAVISLAAEFLWTPSEIYTFHTVSYIIKIWLFVVVAVVFTMSTFVAGILIACFQLLQRVMR